MRRIYDSGAIRRDDRDPHAPAERDDRPQAARSIDGRAWSDRLLPTWLRFRAVSVDIDAPDSPVPAGETVPFVVTLRNTLPAPVSVPTTSPRPWTWYVDDIPEASHVDSIPSEASSLRFDRGERKRFRRQWDGMFRVSDDMWERAPSGEYTVSVRLSVGDPVSRGLYSESVVRIGE